MIRFYPDGESSLKSEKLGVKWSESLIAQRSKCLCGSCRTTVHHAEITTRCPDPRCGVQWKQVIYTESTVSFQHRQLMMICEAASSAPEHARPPDAPRSYPTIGRRAVENVIVSDGLL